MNRLGKIGAIALAVCLLGGTSAIRGLRADAAESYTARDFTPQTDPDGKRIETVYRADNVSDYGHVYDWNGNQETTALGYGTNEHEGNVMRYVYTPGGGFLTRNQIAISTKKTDITTANGLMFYLDSTDLQNGAGLKVSMRFALTPYQNVGDYDGDHTYSLMPQEGTRASVRRMDSENWEQKVVTDSYVELGEGFEGWVYLPLSGYRSAEDDRGGTDTSVHPTATTIASFASLGIVYPCRMRIVVETDDLFESATPLWWSDLSFVKGTEKHEHTMSEEGHVDATCTAYGYTVKKCGTCGERVRTDIVEAHGHELGEAKSDKDGVAYKLCSNCDYAETDETVQNAPAGEDELVTVTFDYGDAGGSAVRKFRKGHVIGWQDVPFKMTYKRDNWWIYQFNCWTTDADNLEPVNAVGQTAENDVTYYARYIISNYSTKYVGALCFVAANGGAYTPNRSAMGKAVVCGNSNPSLYHTMVDDFAPEISVLNNSIAGSTSYDMIEYYKAIVLTFKPTMVILNLTTNDHAYYNLSDRQIMENMGKLYEMTRQYSPETVVVFTSALPLPGRTEYWDAIYRINNTMIEYVAVHDHCEYVNTYKAASDYANTYPVGWEFWTHLDLEGLRHTYSYLKTALIGIAEKYGINY